MKTRTLTLFALAVALLVASTPMFAHHGSSAYDKKLTTVKGTVTDFQFMNPHSEIFLEVKNADGKVEKWSAEAASMVTMSRLGWSKNLFKAGDQITIVGIARETALLPCVSARSCWPTARSIPYSAARITRINRENERTRDRIVAE